MICLGTNEAQTMRFLPTMDVRQGSVPNLLSDGAVLAGHEDEVSLAFGQLQMRQPIHGRFCPPTPELKRVKDRYMKREGFRQVR